ncbi:ATP-binding cassette domain-containing protein [Neiella marina]|uniref:ATP-binding cassette domain-containing protein n=1 Tax=Neiella holothuriorum TaxID=2870530 RepID=A0ABS7EF40_9GAMM|nr:ATP-binding cassette domain-containing protein [Neiella holothuriorum]MBW8190962.1 ATP-binding cassette domain-containing protein [Neiella holothuriorum]
MLIQQLTTDRRNQTRGKPPLIIERWDLANVSWAVVGNNDSGKEQLLDILRGDLLYQGSISGATSPVAEVSLGLQQRLVEREIEQDESDLLDEVDPGTRVFDLMLEAGAQPNQVTSIAHQLNLHHLLEQGFRSLSTGETKRLLIARALLAKPSLLLVQDPFDGLDQTSKSLISNLLQQRHADGLQLIVLIDRLLDVPTWLKYGAIFYQGRLVEHGALPEICTRDTWLNLKLAEAPPRIPLALAPSSSLPINEPVFEIRHGKVSYGDKVVFSDLNWRIEQGQHWRVIGPNGSGKSTLLKLISGDHPQCYANQIRQFGFQRGSGESIWQIKQHIGLVSAEFHLNYRARVTTIAVVLSGFFDSIGLYQEPNRHQINLALSWLDWFHLADKAQQPFHQLSYGQQRLVLIIRALIKSPYLLILDEPLQGLDEASSQLVLTAINRMMAAGVGQLLYVSHRDEPQLKPSCQVLELTK